MGVAVIGRDGGIPVLHLASVLSNQKVMQAIVVRQLLFREDGCGAARPRPRIGEDSATVSPPVSMLFSRSRAMSHLVRPSRRPSAEHVSQRSVPPAAPTLRAHFFGRASSKLVEKSRRFHIEKPILAWLWAACDTPCVALLRFFPLRNPFAVPRRLEGRSRLRDSANQRRGTLGPTRTPRNARHGGAP